MLIPRSRSLLVTFDAFGTLYSPRMPVPIQYARVAKEYGVVVNPDDVQDSFIVAYKALCLELPNYGKAKGITPEDWWKMVVNNTFQPLVSVLPTSLAPAVINYFASASAYTLHPVVPTLLRQIRNCPISARHPAPATIGVISNSDPRVPFIIRDLGVGIRNYITDAPEESTAHTQNTRMGVGDFRNSNGKGTDIGKTRSSPPPPGTTSSNTLMSGSNMVGGLNAMAEKMLEKTDEVQQEWGAPECVNGEVDFLTLSYDVGVQKPDRGIFEAAEKMALQYVGEDEEAVENGEQRWQGRRVHVGDEWKKDVEAARNAGWEGVLWRDDITEEEILEKILGPEEDI